MCVCMYVCLLIENKILNINMKASAGRYSQLHKQGNGQKHSMLCKVNFQCITASSSSPTIHITLGSFELDSKLEWRGYRRISNIFAAASHHLFSRVLTDELMMHR